MTMPTVEEVRGQLSRLKEETREDLASLREAHAAGNFDTSELLRMELDAKVLAHNQRLEISDRILKALFEEYYFPSVDSEHPKMGAMAALQRTMQLARVLYGEKP